MARIRVSTTVDESLLENARRLRSDLNDAALATMNGVERFAPGGYEIVIQVWHGSTLVLDSHLDPQGFGVFEGGPGIKG